MMAAATAASEAAGPSFATRAGAAAGRSASITALHLRTSIVIGGVETVLADWERALPACGVRARLFCFENARGSERAFVEFLRQRDQAITSLPWGPRKSVARAVLALAREARASPRPCVLHSHDVRARVVCVLAAKLARVPHVASVHAWHDVPGKVRFLEAVDARALRFADVVVNCSEATRRDTLARGIPDGRAITIYNGLDFAPFGRAVDRAAARKALGVASDDFVIGNVARLYPEKGQDTLLRAAAELLPRYPRLKVVIVGDGPERARLEALRKTLGIEQAVLMPGFRADLVETYAALDLFCLPSLAEGVPQVIYAAMAMRTPIVACPVDGVAEVLSHQRTALLTPPGDVPALATSLGRLIDDRALASRLADAAHAHAKSNYAVDATAHRLAVLYAGLACRSEQGITRA